MKKNSVFNGIILIVGYFSFAIGMEHKAPSIEYRRATTQDVDSIVDLINTQAYKDDNKIVVVPEKFRLSYVQHAVDDKRLFIAFVHKRVVGYKKLFCIRDQQECNDILDHELRCTKKNEVGSLRINILDGSRIITSVDSTKLRSLPVTYVYNGADFTHPDYRGRGINHSLTQYALDDLFKEVLEHAKDQKSTHLAMVYGLTESNAGIDNRNLLDGRNRSIAQHFISFAQGVAKTLTMHEPSHVTISRYEAFKPSFDPTSSECIPLPDKESIKGYGYLITCGLDARRKGE